MKNLCLDIGNVIFDVDIRPFAARLSEVSNSSLEDIEKFLRRFHHSHDLGQTTIEDEIRDRLGIKSQIVLSELMSSWNDSIQPRTDIIQRLFTTCLTHKLDIALLSNIGIEHLKVVKSKLSEDPITLKFYEYAKKHFSCEVGARKPQKLFYQSFLQQHSHFKDAVYVDDLMINLEASQQFGFETVHMSLETSDIPAKLAGIERLLLR